MEKNAKEVICNKPGCNKKGQTLEEFLSCYNADKYKKPSVTVDMLIFCEKKGKEGFELLMIQRADHPCIGQWALPGGFVEMDENLEDAAKRELKEETHLEEAYLEQLYTYGDVNRDPRGRTISVAYLAVVDEKDEKLQADDDAKAANWFCVSCKLLTEKLETTDLNEKVTKKIQDYEIELESAQEKLSAQVRCITIQKGRWKKEEMQILNKNQIAFDHAKIILKGYLKVTQKNI